MNASRTRIVHSIKAVNRIPASSSGSSALAEFVDSLIHCVERLVIETRFEGKGTDFAWVVPLPAVPRIEPATSGVFRTLEFLTRPDIRHDVAAIWRWIMVLGSLAWLGATVRPTGSGHCSRTVGSWCPRSNANEA